MMADMKCKEHQLKKRFFSRSIVVKVEGQMKRGTKCDLSSAAQLIFKQYTTVDENPPKKSQYEHQSRLSLAFKSMLLNDPRVV